MFLHAQSTTIPHPPQRQNDMLKNEEANQSTYTTNKISDEYVRLKLAVAPPRHSKTH